MPRRSNYRLLFGLDILLDLVCEGRPQHAEANKVIELCNGEGDMGFVAAASLKDAYRIFCKQYGEESARRAVGFLMNLLIIVPLSAEECDIERYRLHPHSERVRVRALEDSLPRLRRLSRDCLQRGLRRPTSYTQE